jgi:hypothetical protein
MRISLLPEVFERSNPQTKNESSYFAWIPSLVASIDRFLIITVSSFHDRE